MSEKLDATPDVAKAQEAAKAATTPETFDFAAAVLDRSYPEDDVAVYLDEKRIKRLLEVEAERDALEVRIAKSKKPGIDWANKLDELTKEYDALVDSLRSQRYTVKIKGISPEDSIELEEKAYEAFPREYEEVPHTVTGHLVKTEKPSDKRDEHFAALIRQAHIVSITAPNGAVDTNFSDVEKVKAVWQRLPLVARAKLDQAINEATITVDFYRELVDEVF